MNDFDPGPGWREIDPEESPDSERILWISADAEHRRWVREVPLPQLPTEKWTVARLSFPAIEAEGIDGVQQVAVFDGEQWRPVHQNSWMQAEKVDGFELLSEPRAVTAKAVLDRIATKPWAREVDLEKWRRDFGVES